MGLIDFPNPGDWINSFKMGDLERQAANAAMSAAYSAWITFTWRSGSSALAQWLGEGKALQDAAISAYKTLEVLERKNFLALTVPQDLLLYLESPDNRFQTEQKVK